MSRLESQMRPHLLGFVEYSSARDEFVLGEDVESQPVLLDANENPFELLSCEKAPQLNRYPDPLQRELRGKTASLIGVQTSNVLMTSGSDEGIELLFELFCEPGSDSVSLFEPSYGMYEVAARKHNIKIQREQLDTEFQLPILESGEIACSSGSKLYFVCSPNNPTGNLIDVERIELLLRQTDSYVVVDEAYVDFAKSGSALSLLEKYENLILLRTFSKAWGLAAVRLGYVIARAEVISSLSAIKPPYNLGNFAASLGLEALSAAPQIRDCVQRIVEQRDLLAEEILKLAFVERVFPSDANFLLVRFRQEYSASQIQESLRDRGVVVRNRSALVLCENCLRISVGTGEQNQRLLFLLREFEK